jgi:hypothetical protein
MAGQGREQVSFSGEVAVDGGLGDSGLLGDRGHGDLQRMLAVDQRGEGLDDPLLGDHPLGLAKRRP